MNPQQTLPRSMVINRPVTAVLGPTNTGKTHYALDRMAAHESGMIGLPLRLLAREVFEKMVARKSPREVALVTGEEKIIPPNAKYFVCTVEAMPMEREVAFLAIDEIQLAADRERGRIFTHRLLHARGLSETLLLGSDTMKPILRRLIPDIGFVSRERFSKLEFIGHKKATRLPRRSAIVAFSADSVYSIAELIRRQRGGAAIIMGALSPRTRNAQAELYQSGEVDYLVATDAIGMGLNMDIDHVAFAALRKFDGVNNRLLMPAEMAQIAGRAGRHIRDGTFGTTADCVPIDEETAELIENHEFEPVTALQWRSNALEFGSLPALMNALDKKPPRRELVRSRVDEDEDALKRLAKFEDIRAMATGGGAALRLLWDICQTPDFRNVSPDQHAQMLAEIYRQLMDRGRIAEGWLRPKLERLERTDGDVDALSARIAHVRTWTYLTHKSGWLENSAYWQEKARAIEDALSDALHQKLTQRFIDRRTSVLLKKLKDDAPLLAGVTPEGEVIVEGEFVGRLIGFQFMLDPRAKGPHAKAVRHAALKALKPELAARASALANAKDKDFSLRDGNTIWWRNSAVARLEKGPLPLRPEIRLVAMEHLPVHSLPRIEARIRNWFADKVEGLLLPLMSLQKAVNQVAPKQPAEGMEGDEDKAAQRDILAGTSRGLGYRLIENFGATSRAQVADEVKALDQNERGKLRKLGVRFGEYTIFLPALLKPAPAEMLTALWALWSEKDISQMDRPKAGLTSFVLNPDVPHAYYYALGYRPSGQRAVRIDMLERLSQEIRGAREKADMREGFEPTSKMMSLVGCSGEEFESILKSLGLRKNTVKKMVPKEQPATARADGKTDTPAASEGASEVEATKDETVEGAIDPATEKTAETQANPETVQTVPEQAEVQAETADTIEDGAPATEATAAEAQMADAAGTSSSASLAASAEASPAEASPAEASPTDADAVPESVEMEEVEVTLWKLAPRHTNKPRRKTGEQRDGKPAGEARGKRADNADGRRDGRKGGPKGKGGKPPFKDKGPRTFTAGPSRKTKEADPDSPFAILAALKDKS
ncbi:helicase-related protein [Aquisalinus flavus]|uniref:helicase-related protein n=1 Tax=Aquisalinus flavus TaxID=1526572 RepID=UPI0019D7056D|nr:helicase-related protein [Aquisalinus flavus]